MITREVKILEKAYLMCFSNKVLQEMEQKGISLSDLQNSQKPVGEMVDLVVAAINSGAVYAKHTGAEGYETIDKNFLVEVTGIDDLNDLISTLTECMIGNRQIDAVPGKNVEAAPVGQTK